VRIHRLTTGRVRGPRRSHGASRYVFLRWGDETLPVHAFLVEHPAGLCLVDTGQSLAATRPGYLPRWHPFLRIARFELDPEDALTAQLTRVGHTADELRWIVLTHLHTDHVGGLAEVVGSAEVVVSATEWARARGLLGALRGYVPKQLPRGVEPRRVELDQPALGPFASSHDLVGDGSLTLLPLPGHTPGQIGVLVRWDGGGALLGGDIAHSWRELETVAPEIAAYCRDEGLLFLAAHDWLAPVVGLGSEAPIP
jgi:N-acyl homoserine lactone hydrolase